MRASSSWFRKKIFDLAYPSYEECGPVELLILQPTEFCNIDCTYCYLKNRTSKSRMSEETLEASFRLLINSGLAGSPTTIAWHAGEPLTVGLPFFRLAIDKLKSISPVSLNYSHSIQTNAMLVNDEWAKFFKENNIKIGVSIDGPDFIHDISRLNRSGTGTHSSVMRGVNCLRKHNVDFHTITVLTKKSLSYPKEIMDFLVSIGSSYICFNVEEIEAANKSSSLSEECEEGSQDLCSQFFREVLREIGSSRHPVRVREIDGALAAIAGWNGRSRGMVSGNSQQTHPFKIISIDHKGGFSTYSPELLGDQASTFESFELGNVHKHSLRDAYETTLFKRLYRDIQLGIDICRRDCSYYQMCGGGTPSNKLYENGTFISSSTMFCSMHRKAPIDALLIEFNGMTGSEPPTAP